MIIKKNNPVFFFLRFVILAGIMLSCDKELSQSPVDPEIFRGNLTISSEPSGFLIYLNDKNTGSVTPDSLKFLDPGNYKITLKKKYFKDSTFITTIPENEKIDIFIDYSQNISMHGKLKITSDPSGAAILLNDSLLPQTTPSTITDLMPGEYDIKLNYPEHRSADFTGIVSSGNTAYYYRPLADTSIWVDYQVSNSQINSNNLNCISIDGHGFKWIGSLDKGLIRFDGTNSIVYDKTNSGLPSNKILTVTHDSQNKIWVGTDNGLAIFDGVSWIIYNTSNTGLKSNEILNISFAENGIAWIGTYSGLYKFDGFSWTRYNDNMFSIWVNDLQLDNGKIWIATNNGIVKFENENMTYFYDSVYNFPTNKISSVEKDNSGNLWFGHLNSGTKRNGISFYDGNSFQFFYLGTSSNAINNIAVDAGNNKWICSNEGLYRISNANNQTVYNKSNSLISSDKLSCAVVDNNGDIWITTYFNGLIKFKFSKL